MKTIKEQIEEKAKEYLYDSFESQKQQEALAFPHSNKDFAVKDFTCGMEAGISLAQRWIDVSELSENGKVVLIKDRDGCVSIGYFVKDVGWFDLVTADFEDIVEWRPIDITIE